MSLHADTEATEVEEEVQQYEEIEKLQELGIGATDIKKLKEANIHTIAMVWMTPKKRMLEIKGMSEAKVNKIYEVAAKIQDFSFITGTKVMEKRKQVFRISTGCTALDELLGGGIDSSSITEAFGEFRTGKTQLAHTLAVTAQVVYIDTEGTFRPERIMSIAERFGVDGQQVLDNILYARCHTHEHQMHMITQTAAKMIEEHFSMVIMDSATALFRVDFTGRGQLSERQNKLGCLLSMLTKLAEEFNVAVYLTNQVMADPSGGGTSFVQDPKKPIGGHIMAHACTTRLFLRKGRAEQRVCKIYDSPSLPEAEAIYQLSDGGITNAKD